MRQLADIENLDQYWCLLYKYSISHFSLYIEMGLNKPEFYLLFPTVRYFSGPTHWRGANFQIASPDECLHRLKSTGFFDAPELYGIARKEDTVLEQYKLYKLPLKSCTVEIVAGGLNVLDNPPSWAVDES